MLTTCPSFCSGFNERVYITGDMQIGQPNPEARGLVTQRRGRAVPPSKRENLVYRIRLLLPIVKVSANRGM